MAMSNTKADQAWGLFADADEEERRAKMLQRYVELASQPEDERTSQMVMMATAEYALPDDKLRAFTHSRLSVWLEMDPEVVQIVAASYDAVMQRMPGPQAMRRVSLVQTLAKDFPQEGRERLVALLPNVFGGLKEMLYSRRLAESAPTAPAKKSWWPFGKRNT